jgi:hypothetical protein
MDVWKIKRWAAFLIPAGTNALLAYILPDLWNNWTALLGLGGLWWNYGWPYLQSGGTAGLLNALAVALFMVWLTKLGGKAGFNLKF